MPNPPGMPERRHLQDCVVTKLPNVTPTVPSWQRWRQRPGARQGRADAPLKALTPAGRPRPAHIPCGTGPPIRPFRRECDGETAERNWSAIAADITSPKHRIGDNSEESTPTVMSPANTMSDEALASSSAKGPSPSANEPFVLLANGTRGAAAIGLVRQVLEAPGVFVFGELLDHPNVRALGDDSSSTADGPKYFHLLELFAYGTYQEYQSQKTALPPLTDAMTKKLRLLTLASLATGRRLLSYDKLLKELQINNVRELEDVIIEGASANVVQGKLDQKERHFEVDFTMARDIRMVKYTSLKASKTDRNIWGIFLVRGKECHQHAWRLVQKLWYDARLSGSSSRQSQRHQSRRYCPQIKSRTEGEAPTLSVNRC